MHLQEWLRSSAKGWDQGKNSPEKSPQRDEKQQVGGEPRKVLDRSRGMKEIPDRHPSIVQGSEVGRESLDLMALERAGSVERWRLARSQGSRWWVRKVTKCRDEDYKGCGCDQSQCVRSLHTQGPGRWAVIHLQAFLRCPRSYCSAIWGRAGECYHSD